MDTLATIKDLDSYGIEYADEKLAGKLLESVSAAVRDAAGCPITRGEYTVTIPGETSRRLDLPMRPVISVSRVLMDGEQTGDWKLLGNALYRESLWSLPNMVPRSITVTMLAGYDPIPRTSCASCAAWSQPDSSSSRTAAPALTATNRTRESTTCRSATVRATPRSSTHSNCPRARNEPSATGSACEASP